MKALVAAIGVVTATVIALAVATAPEEPPVRPPVVVSDARLIPMLDGHTRMTEQMQVATPTKRMTSSMVTDPVWGDWSADMVREQEAYQAQIDRMLARR